MSFEVELVHMTSSVLINSQNPFCISGNVSNINMVGTMNEFIMINEVITFVAINDVVAAECLDVVIFCTTVERFRTTSANKVTRQCRRCCWLLVPTETVRTPTGTALCTMQRLEAT